MEFLASAFLTFCPCVLWWLTVQMLGFPIQPYIKWVFGENERPKWHFGRRVSLENQTRSCLFED